MVAIDWLVENWALVLLILAIADKVVAVTPCKWDDLIVTAVKKGLLQFFKR